MVEGNQRSQEAAHWAARLEAALHDGIEIGLPDSYLTQGVARVLELQRQADEQAAAARLAGEARAALAATPIRTPRSSEWRAFGTPRLGTPRNSRDACSRTPLGTRSSAKAVPAAKAFRTPREGTAAAATPAGGARTADTHAALMREGSLVALRGLEGVMGISYSGLGNFDMSLSLYK